MENYPIFVLIKIGGGFGTLGIYFVNPCLSLHYVRFRPEQSRFEYGYKNI